MSYSKVSRVNITFGNTSTFQKTKEVWLPAMAICRHFWRKSARGGLYGGGFRHWRKLCPTCHHCSFLPQNQFGYCFGCVVSFCEKKSSYFRIYPSHPVRTVLYVYDTVYNIHKLFVSLRKGNQLSNINYLGQYPLFSCSSAKLFWNSPELSLLERDYERTQSWAAMWAAPNPLVSRRVIISNISHRCGQPWIPWWAGEL